MSISRRIIAVTAFLILVFAVIPILIAVSGRKDFYYTLSSVALLSMASAGVWLW